MKNRKLRIVRGKEAQKTLKESVSLNGLSFGGKICRLVIEPAPEDTGLVFVVGETQIPANYIYLKRENEEYTTILRKGNLEIKSVEHLLSALWGTGIDNALIKLETGEIPLRDASAESYTKMLNQAGVTPQKSKRIYLRVEKKMKFVFTKDTERYAIFLPADQLKIKATSIFKNIIGRQNFLHTWSPEIYIQQISWARSFMNSPIDEDNGEVWERVRRKIPLLPQNPKYSPLIVYTREKYLTPLKVPNEPVRHKVLDFYGDIALLGVRLLAEVRLFKPGHAFTQELVKLIAREIDG